jgi:propanediol dehydratase small subunit
MAHMSKKMLAFYVVLAIGLIFITESVWLTMIIAAFVAYLCYFNDSQDFRAIKRRPCSGRDWRRRFPDLSRESLREFLIICSANFYLFGKKNSLKLTPDDRIRAIGLACGADGCDYDEFCSAMSTFYHIDLNELWYEEMTFGELLTLASRSDAQRLATER